MCRGIKGRKHSSRSPEKKNMGGPALKITNFSAMCTQAGSHGSLWLLDLPKQSLSFWGGKAYTLSVYYNQFWEFLYGEFTFEPLTSSWLTHHKSSLPLLCISHALTFLILKSGQTKLDWQRVRLSLKHLCNLSLPQSSLFIIFDINKGRAHVQEMCTEQGLNPPLTRVPWMIREE